MKIITQNCSLISEELIDFSQFKVLVPQTTFCCFRIVVLVWHEHLETLIIILLTEKRFITKEDASTDSQVYNKILFVTNNELLIKQFNFRFNLNCFSIS